MDVCGCVREYGGILSLCLTVLWHMERSCYETWLFCSKAAEPLPRI